MILFWVREGELHARERDSFLCDGWSNLRCISAFVFSQLGATSWLFLVMVHEQITSRHKILRTRLQGTHKDGSSLFHANKRGAIAISETSKTMMCYEKNWHRELSRSVNPRASRVFRLESMEPLVKSRSALQLISAARTSSSGEGDSSAVSNPD